MATNGGTRLSQSCLRILGPDVTVKVKQEARTTSTKVTCWMFCVIFVLLIVLLAACSICHVAFFVLPSIFCRSTDGHDADMRRKI